MEEHEVVDDSRSLGYDLSIEEDDVPSRQLLGYMSIQSYGSIVVSIVAHVVIFYNIIRNVLMENLNFDLAVNIKWL